MGFNKTWGQSSHTYQGFWWHLSNGQRGAETFFPLLILVVAALVGRLFVRNVVQVHAHELFLQHQPQLCGAPSIIPSPWHRWHWGTSVFSSSIRPRAHLSPLELWHLRHPDEGIGVEDVDPWRTLRQRRKHAQIGAEIYT